VIDVPRIEYIVAQDGAHPAKQVSASDKDVLRNLDRNLKMVVFGQDEAIDVLTAAIKMARSGLGDPEQADRLLPVRRPDRRRQDRGHAPARDAAGHRADPLRHVRVHGAHSVSRLIGAPPGYVGFDQGGLLTEAVVKHPHACCCWTRSRRRIRTSSTCCCR
jgi:ATP-dependent Clp protease ATP-binding subunit ClpA